MPAHSELRLNLWARDLALRLCRGTRPSLDAYLSIIIRVVPCYSMTAGYDQGNDLACAQIQ